MSLVNPAVITGGLIFTTERSYTVTLSKSAVQAVLSPCTLKSIRPPFINSGADISVKVSNRVLLRYAVKILLVIANLTLLVVVPGAVMVVPASSFHVVYQLLCFSIANRPET